MILISLQPFNLKKIAGLVAAIVCLSTVSGFAQSLLLSVPSTPYDHQMARIQPVLLEKAAAHNSSVSLGRGQPVDPRPSRNPLRLQQ